MRSFYAFCFYQGAAVFQSVFFHCRTKLREASAEEVKSLVASVWYDIMKLLFERKTRLGQTMQSHFCLGKRLCKMSLQENEELSDDVTIWEKFLYKITR